MKLNFNNNFAFDSSPLYKNQGIQRASKLNIVDRVEDNIKRKSDILEISEQGQLKLKLRNLEQASELEKRSDEIKENIIDRIKLFESVKSTIQEIIELVKESMDEGLSSEDKEQIQSDIKDIEGFIEEAIKNNPNKTVSSIEENFIKNSNNIQKNIDTEKLNEESSLGEIKEDDNKTYLNKIDILENPKDALMALGNALGPIMEEILRLTKQLGELDKNIEKLLGEYDERKELKNLKKLEDITNDINDSSAKESKDGKEKE